jgi:hypothetical protein
MVIWVLFYFFIPTHKIVSVAYWSFLVISSRVGGPVPAVIVESFALLAVATSFMKTLLGLSEFLLQQVGKAQGSDSWSPAILLTTHHSSFLLTMMAELSKIHEIPKPSSMVRLHSCAVSCPCRCPSTAGNLWQKRVRRLGIPSLVLQWRRRRRAMVLLKWIFRAHRCA